MDTWLCVLRPARAEMPNDPTDDERRLVGEHFAYLTSLRDAGTVVLAGRTTTDDTFGIVIYGGTEEDVRALLDRDPAVSGGVMNAELLPFSLAIPPR